MYRLIIVVFTLMFAYQYSYSAEDRFQQKVVYEIDVRLDDQQQMLHGYEVIHYTNHSPDLLEVIYLHLWPNAYRNNRTTLAREQFELEGKHHLFNIPSQRGYIDSLDFRVNQQPVDWDYHPEHLDIGRLKLNEPLEPGETITITTPFRVKIPLAVTSRLGYVDQSYKISHWYPKPAVYDQNGWNLISYQDQADFYSEFGAYKVNITLPENYVVAATGVLVTESERKWLNEKARRTNQKLGFNVFDTEIPISSPNEKTIQYEADTALDFAWFADKRYHVLKKDFRIPQSGRNVTSSVFFTNEQAELWLDANAYVESVLQRFSGWYGAYPYETYSVVLGAPGSQNKAMGYGNLSSVGYVASSGQLEQAIVKTASKAWFSSLLHFNEYHFPFMDEGLSEFSEVRYFSVPGQEPMKFYEYYDIKEGVARFLGIDHLDFYAEQDLKYVFNARRNLDQPTRTTTKQLSRVNKYAVAEAKSAKAFMHLMHYLGERQFDQVLRSFISKWKFSHVQPTDLQPFFRSKTGKKLDWFFQELLENDQTVDYALRKHKNGRLLVKNKGSVAAPLVIAGKNGEEIQFRRWYEGFQGQQWLMVPTTNAEVLELDPNHVMVDLYRHNNRLKTHGLFPGAEPLKLEFFGLMNDPDYTQIHYFPSLGWNYYDKTMLGMLLYDAPLPPDQFDYILSPFFSTGNSTLSGTGFVEWKIFPKHIFRKVQWRISAKRFGFSDLYGGMYEQFYSHLNFYLNAKSSKAFADNKLHLSATYATDIYDVVKKIENNGEGPLGKNIYVNLSLHHDYSDRTINPYHIMAGYEWSPDFSRATLETGYQYSYYMNEGLSFRFFGGVFLNKASDLPWNYGFHLSGGNGWQDYRYQHTYLGRFENPTDEYANQLFVQQYYPEEGAFTTYSALGITKDWLASLHVKTAVPVIEDLPIHLYANVGTFGTIAPVEGVAIENKTWAYETGVEFSFLNLLDIYFPVTTSQNLRKASDYITTRYGEKIRFHMKFDLLRPERLIEEIEAFF